METGLVETIQILPDEESKVLRCDSQSMAQLTTIGRVNARNFVNPGASGLVQPSNVYNGCLDIEHEFSKEILRYKSACILYQIPLF